MSGQLFEIDQYEFSNDGLSEIKDNHYASNFWPSVYILSDGNVKQAYVGESADIPMRIATHLKNNQKNILKAVHLITSQKFNKSAALDIESNLIRYMSADGQFGLLNSNLGLANHNYYQKNELYWKIFNDVWDELRSRGVVKNSIEFVDNSDLFKYSPYKSLSIEQQQGLHTILTCLLDDGAERVVMEGGAGTGKTILAVFLFKILVSDKNAFKFDEGDPANVLQQLANRVKDKFPDLKLGLVVPMSSFRSTLKKVFKGIKGLNSNMVIGPAEVARSKYDLLIVDEAHRLRRRVNLGAYFGAFDKACAALNLDKNDCSEMDWVLRQSTKSIFFYDSDQSIKPSDVTKQVFENLKSDNRTRTESLKSQFRVKGGNAYVEFVDGLLQCKLTNETGFSFNDYEVLLFDSLEDLVTRIKTRDKDYGLSRLIAGYAWPWVSKNDKTAFDIDENGVKLKWNSTPKDWINSENSVDEVGCIHTTQGYDLNYTGIIFGREISYDPDRNQIVIDEKKYFDKYGKQSIKDIEDLKKFIINIYKTILLRGIKGTYIYACDPKLQRYLARFIPVAASSENKKVDYLRILPTESVRPFENAIPLYGLKAAAGAFSDPQNIEDLDWIDIPEGYKSPNDLFACRVVGESMNRIIPNGSVCLFRKDRGGSRNGKIVLVEHAGIYDVDSGSCYTVKEYQSYKSQDGDEWFHKSIRLKPFSDKPEFEELVLTEDQVEIYRVVGVFERVLGFVS